MDDGSGCGQGRLSWTEGGFPGDSCLERRASDDPFTSSNNFQTSNKLSLSFVLQASFDSPKANLLCFVEFIPTPYLILNSIIFWFYRVFKKSRGHLTLFVFLQNELFQENKIQVALLFDCEDLESLVCHLFLTSHFYVSSIHKILLKHVFEHLKASPFLFIFFFMDSLIDQTSRKPCVNCCKMHFRNDHLYHKSLS